MSDWPFADLQAHSYGLILADPPWRFDVRSARGDGKAPPYPTMTRRELLRLPVWRLAAPNCALVMWTTAPTLDFSIDLLKTWGFDYKSAGSWAKETRNSDPDSDPAWAFGPGYWFRSAAEFFIAGAYGAPAIKSRSERNLIVARLREHSRKPDEMHEMLERMFPLTKKLELFARQRREGWDCWGNETDKFPAESEAR